MSIIDDINTADELAKEYEALEAEKITCAYSYTRKQLDTNAACEAYAKVTGLRMDAPAFFRIKENPADFHENQLRIHKFANECAQEAINTFTQEDRDQIDLQESKVEALKQELKAVERKLHSLKTTQRIAECGQFNLESTNKTIAKLTSVECTSLLRDIQNFKTEEKRALELDEEADAKLASYDPLVSTYLEAKKRKADADLWAFERTKDRDPSGRSDSFRDYHPASEEELEQEKQEESAAYENFYAAASALAKKSRQE